MSTEHKTDVDTLRSVGGVGPAIAKQLANRYATWDELADADRDSLKQMSGLGHQPKVVTEILTLAASCVARMELASEDLKPEPKPLAKPQVEEGDEGVQWVLSERRIDPNTVLNTRVKLTPAVCAECGLSLVDAWGMLPYDQLSPPEQAKLQKSMLAHKADAHGASKSRVISDADMRAINTTPKAA